MGLHSLYLWGSNTSQFKKQTKPNFVLCIGHPASSMGSIPRFNWVVNLWFVCLTLSLYRTLLLCVNPQCVLHVEPVSSGPGSGSGRSSDWTSTRERSLPWVRGVLVSAQSLYLCGTPGSFSVFLYFDSFLTYRRLMHILLWYFLFSYRSMYSFFCMRSIFFFSLFCAWKA